MVNINEYIKALLHPAGGHQGSHKAHQAGNQKEWKYFPLYWPSCGEFPGHRWIPHTKDSDVPEATV